MNKILMFNSSRFGQGNPRLGESLMKDFFEALAMMDEKPDAILFYNSAVILACKDSPVLNPLQSLAKRGTEVLVSASSLHFYNMDKILAAGRIADMEEMAGLIMQADSVIKP